ncbi:homeobox protein Hox-D3a-like [Channa argus]|uniref:homeobox protein Hox-D3a-like n=1 Tax=Channa argus TaxID=215402 RepID=UPI002946BD2E|nr:hypothetical protein Q8A73_020280 [Channa argus]
MADWKPQVNYNYYNSSYYAYACGLMYQHELDQNNENPSSSKEIMDLSNYNPGLTPAYYAAPAINNTRDKPLHGISEQHAGTFQNRGSGVNVIYFNDTQAGCLRQAAQQATYGAESEVRRGPSESTSDSEAHVSPDSWSSEGSGGTSLPQADPTTRVEEDHGNNAISRSPDGNNHVSSSLLGEPVTETDESNFLHVPLNAPAKSSTKGKVRAAFSEMQMNALVQRFTVQRYLTPAEMKGLGEMIGLSYKQVKTWFQNRRMKLRRHQKDNTWLCERSNITQSPNRKTVYNGNSSNVPPSQGETQYMENHNHPVMAAPFRETPLQNLYLAAMGNAAGSSGLASGSWSSNTSQTAMPTRPQMAAWSILPGVAHYEYNPNALNLASTNSTDTNFESKIVEPVNAGSVRSASQ